MVPSFDLTVRHSTLTADTSNSSSKTLTISSSGRQLNKTSLSDP